MDKQQADNIITEYFQKIYGFAIKKSFSYDEAEDLCGEIIQEVYLSLLKAKDIFNIEGYIWRISEHTYSKYVSSKKKQEGISINGDMLDTEIPSCDDFTEALLSEDSEEEIAKLRREIAFLTEKRRQIVYYFYYEDKSISFISKTMGIPEGTVKWHLNKARNELKEGFSMERKIGKLGLSPITAVGHSHSGSTGKNGGPEFYLEDKLNLNIVYSVYFSPKTKEEIAEELGLTLVFIEDKIDYLEGNGFLVRTTGNRYTTYVKFDPQTYSLEMEENWAKKQLEAAKILAEEYVPLVRAAIADIDRVYIPGGNRELLEAVAIFYGIVHNCHIAAKKDLSNYFIKTTDGGKYIATVHLHREQSDPDYKPTLSLETYYTCGSMTHWSEKYTSVHSWSVDSKYSSRKGGWENNLTTDYEYLYEFLNGTLVDNPANAEKLNRLREREFLTADNKVNIMIMQATAEDFFKKIPKPDEGFKERFADYALETAMLEAKAYPPQMQDLVINWGVGSFIGNEVALMVLDILYGDGTFKPLTESEKVTSTLLMFSDILPQ